MKNQPAGVVRNGRNNRRDFFMEFLKHPLQIGSVIPSSRFLERRIVEAADFAGAKTIVELGPGTGGTTRAILQAMPQEARFLCIEINPYFHDLLQQIDDDRLIPHLGSAADLRRSLRLYDLPPPDIVVSGIPFSHLSVSEGSELIDEIHSLLADGGCFLAYQARNRVASLTKPFQKPSLIRFELLNIPPMRIYRWDKAEP